MNKLFSILIIGLLCLNFVYALNETNETIEPPEKTFEEKFDSAKNLATAIFLYGGLGVCIFSLFIWLFTRFHGSGGKV